MNLEKYLSLITHRSESIIQWLFLAILLLSGLLIARALFGKKVEESKSSGGIDLQTALQKIMEQTTKLESVSLEKLNAQGVAQVEAQVQALKTDLASREAELTQLKSSGSNVSSEAADKLGVRIKELEAKLSEYEILEDDIADLSLYKEENTRLRTEIDRLKGGVAPASTAVAVEGGELVEEFAQAVSNPPATEAPEVTVAAIPDTGDPMADFENAVDLEKELEEKLEAASASPVAAAPGAPPKAAPPIAPAPAAPSASDTQQEADDLFAEFSSGSDEATLDTEKMMAEMAALVGMEPATGSSLEESIDTEKMAAEATTLQKS